MFAIALIYAVNILAEILGHQWKQLKAYLKGIMIIKCTFINKSFELKTSVNLNCINSKWLEYIFKYKFQFLFLYFTKNKGIQQSQLIKPQSNKQTLTYKKYQLIWYSTLQYYLDVWTYCKFI